MEHSSDDTRDVVWAPNPFDTTSGNPRPWLVVAGEQLPYAGEESIGVAFTAQSHHPGSFPVPSSAWFRGKPNRRSHVLPWTVATLKDDIHVVGTQGTVVEEFTRRVATATISYLDDS